MTRATSSTPLRRTKIVATLGPASDRPGVLEAMLKTYVENPGRELSSKWRAAIDAVLFSTGS